MRFERFLWLGMILAGSVAADEEPWLDEAMQDFAGHLREVVPELQIVTTGDGPISGFKWVLLEDGSILHLPEANPKHFLHGSLYQLGDDGLVNLTETRILAPMRVEFLAQQAPRDMVIFASEGTTKARIYVFTDVDCGYCRRFHRDVPALNRSGVEVRYLAFPRTGIGSESYDRIVTAWCSADRNTAMTRLKRGEVLASRNCVNPVAEQFQLGERIGIQGTPTILLESGMVIPGYIPVGDLLRQIGV